MKTSTKLIITVLILLALVGGVYWYIFFYGPGNGTPVVNNNNNNNGTTGGFVPLNAPSNNTNQPTNNNTNNNSNSTNPDNNQNSSSTPVITEKVPALRLLSANPIGGYGASTTASTTIVRWVDRGRGNIMEAKGDTEEISTLSNTILPRVYISIWNKNLTAFIGSLLSSNNDIPTVVYAKLNTQASSTQQKTSTTTTNTDAEKVTPYFLRGKNLPQNMITYAVSPKGDKLFMLIKESGQGAGYISNFDGTSVTKIFIQPLTQVSVEWPEENTVAITTNGSASQAGFLYFINPKTGIWKKIIGPVFGISTKVSKDAKFVLVSGSTNSQSITTNIYPVGTTTPIDAVVKTLADKCAWGNYYKELVYCATPSQPISGIYPDDWYKGVVTSYDKIWQINVKNNDIRQVSSLLGQANKLINVFNMSTDSRDDFLFFMNKDDLSLWSLDLNSR
jgi:hypothetical protein